MSVVVWDGESVAADKAAISSDMRARTTKLWRIETGEILAWTGTQDCGLLLAQWYKNGAHAAQWPMFQSDKELWTRLIVVSCQGVKYYEIQPVAQMVEDPYMAWGSGRDYAMGALAMGASAVQAVEIASRFCVTCGGGVDVMPVK